MGFAASRAGFILCDALTAEGGLALYRVVQEALSTVIRHAAATRAVVRSRTTDECVEATVEDDGYGFRPSGMEAREACLGLLEMQKRALFVGGTVDIESAPGEGTRIHIRLPGAASAADALWPVILPFGAAIRSM